MRRRRKREKRLNGWLRVEKKTSGSGLVVELPAAATRNLIKVFVALDGSPLDGLAWADGGAATSAISPAAAAIGPATTTTHHAVECATILAPARIRTSVVGTSAVIMETSASHWAAAPDGTARRTVIGPALGMPGRHGGHCSQEIGREAGLHAEAGHGKHVVHSEVLQVEAAGRPSWRLAIGRREVAIGVGIRPRRRDVGRVDNVAVDEFKLGIRRAG